MNDEQRTYKLKNMLHMACNCTNVYVQDAISCKSKTLCCN